MKRQPDTSDDDWQKQLEERKKQAEKRMEEHDAKSS